MAEKEEKKGATPVDELLGLGWTPEEIDELTQIVGTRSAIKSSKDALAAEEEELKGRSIVLFSAHPEQKSIAFPELGMIGIREGGTATLDKDKLREGMLMAGLTVDRVVSIMEAATKRASYVTVEYKPKKEKKG